MAALLLSDREWAGPVCNVVLSLTRASYGRGVQIEC